MYLMIPHKNNRWAIWPIYFALLFTLFWLSLSACSRQNTSSTVSPTQTGTQEEGATQELDKISFALDWTPNTNHTGLYVAQKLGYFQDAGLEVDISMPQSSVSQLVASGRVHFGIGYQEFSTNSMANEDLPIVSVAAVLQHNTSGFTSMKNRNIRRPRDFAGKLFAGWGNPFEVELVKYLIEADGGDPQKFDSVSIGETSLAGLLQDKVDYTWTYYAWQNIGFELQGLDTEYIPLKELDPVFDYYTPIIISSRSYLTANADVAKRFVKAVAKGYQYAAKQPEESAVILLSYAPELDPELVRRSQQYLAPYYLDDNGRWGHQNPEIWNKLAQWMYDKQLIDKPLDLDAAMTNEFLPE